MAVGVPGIDYKRMQIKAPVNELDKSSIISIFPRHLAPEHKPTIQPGTFQIPYGTFAKPGILVVGPSSWWKETDEGQPMLEIPHSSIQIAHSVVRDYIVGLLACDMAECRPGIFYIPGVIKEEDLKKTENVAMLELAHKRQKNWFLALVKIGDILWSRTNGNPISVSEDMKVAARELQLDKPWIKDFQSVQMVNCKACGALKNPLYPVCPSCKAIDDPALAAKLGIKFAQ